MNPNQPNNQHDYNPAPQPAGTPPAMQPAPLPAGQAPVVATAATAPQYIKVPPVKLFILNLISANIYGLYWTNYNWKALQVNDSSIKHTIWRTIFSIFYIPSLFTRMSKANGTGEKMFDPTIAVALYYIAISVGLVNNNVPDSSYFLIFVLNVVSYVSVISPFLIQKGIIGTYADAHADESLKSGDAKLLLGIGIFATGLILLGMVANFLLLTGIVEIPTII